MELAIRLARSSLLRSAMCVHSIFIDKLSTDVGGALLVSEHQSQSIYQPEGHEEGRSFRIVRPRDCMARG